MINEGLINETLINGEIEDDTPEPVVVLRRGALNGFSLNGGPLMGGPFVIGPDVDIDEELTLEDETNGVGIDDLFPNAGGSLALATLVTYSYFRLPAVREQLALRSPALSNAIFPKSAQSGLLLTDLLQQIYDLDAADTAALDGSALVYATRLAALVDAVQLVSPSTSGLQAQRAVAETLAMFAKVSEDPDLDETLALDDLATVRAALFDAVNDAVALVAASTTGRVLFVEAPAGFNVSDDIGGQLSMAAACLEALKLGALVLLDGGVFQTWVVNAKTGAATRYSGYAFESMTRIGGTYFGASSDGLFHLADSEDEGGPIAASFKTGELDFGSPELKRVDTAYAGFTSNGQLMMKVTTSQRGRKTERWYKLKNASNAGTNVGARFDIGRGVESRYWQFEVVNVEGSEMEFDVIDLTVIPLSRRIGGK